MADYNPGFAFYDNFYKSIEKLPIEQQKEICYAVVKYGITYEMVDATEMPLGYSFAQAWHEAIENSVDRWVLNQNKANFKIDATMNRDLMIAKLIEEGNTSIKIAEKITELTGQEIDASTVRKSRPWKERKDEDFAVKWLGENVNFSQNGTGENNVNVNSQSQESVKKSQKIVKMEREERENSQKSVNYEGVVDPRF